MKPAVITKSTVRSAAALTTSYVAGTVINIQNKNQVSLAIEYTKGSSTDARIQIEFCYDDSSSGTYYQETFLDALAGTAASNVFSDPLRKHEYVISESGNYALPVRGHAKWIKVSAKASTSGTGTSMTIYLADGNA